MSCTCNGGTLGCIATDACFIPACPDAGVTDGGNGCPASADDALGAACSSAGLLCEYGQECCCGQCYPSISCTCDGNLFACHATDACFRPDCPDAG
jgi:hypothetical protein